MVCKYIDIDVYKYIHTYKYIYIYCMSDTVKNIIIHIHSFFAVVIWEGSEAATPYFFCVCVWTMVLS